MNTTAPLADLPAERLLLSGVDTIVHLGAGLCSELDGYLKCEPNKIYLIEGDPETCNQLHDNSRAFPQVIIEQATVSDTDADAVWTTFNLPFASSLAQPSGLRDLYPGLKTASSKTVRTRAVSELLQALEINPKLRNLLVIELAGIERKVLAALAKEGVLERFSDLQVTIGDAELYEGAGSGAELLRWLSQEGFDSEERDEASDPDQPIWRLRRNPLVQRLRHLETQLSESSNRLAAATQEASKLESELRDALDAKQQAEAQTAEKQKQLEQANQAKARAEKTAAEQTIQLEQLTQAKQQAEAQTAEKQKQLEQANQAKARAEKTAAEQKAQLEQLTQAKQQAEAQTAEKQKQLEQANQAKANAEKTAAEQKAQLEQLAQAKQQAEAQTAEKQKQLEQANQAKANAEEKNSELNIRLRKLEASHFLASERKAKQQ